MFLLSKVLFEVLEILMQKNGYDSETIYITFASVKTGLYAKIIEGAEVFLKNRVIFNNFFRIKLVRRREPRVL